MPNNSSGPYAKVTSSSVQGLELAGIGVGVLPVQAVIRINSGTMMAQILLFTAYLPPSVIHRSILSIDRAAA
jgi:hypothetical protein